MLQCQHAKALKKGQVATFPLILSSNKHTSYSRDNKSKAKKTSTLEAVLVHNICSLSISMNRREAKQWVINQSIARSMMWGGGPRGAAEDIKSFEHWNSVQRNSVVQPALELY